MYKNDRETLKYKLGLQNDIEKMWDITSIPVVTSALSWCSYEKNGKHIYLAGKKWGPAVERGGAVSYHEGTYQTGKSKSSMSHQVVNVVLQ